MKIVYRIVNGLLALAVFPAIIFLPLFDIKISTTLVDVGMELEFSIKRIFDLINGSDMLSNTITPEKLKTFQFPAGAEALKTKAIVFAVFFVLAVLAALAVVIISCITNKRIPYLIGGGVGLLSTIGFMVTFSSMAKMFTSGEISLISMFTDSWLAGLVGGFVKVDSLIIGGFANGMLFLFIGIVLWTGIFYLTEIGEMPAQTATANGNNATKKKKK